MLFNSLEFLVFLPIVFLLYWFVFSRSYRWQNLFLILASGVFYSWWDWRTLPLIFLTIVSTYFSALGIRYHQNKTTEQGIITQLRWYQNKAWLISAANIVFNLGILCVFKYYNFFIQSFIDVFQTFGIHLEFSTLQLVLPVGISFYTFRALSYSIDVYTRKVEPTCDFLAFFSFLIFFPFLLAGPIERASNMLHQFLQKRIFIYEMGTDGMRQILWGLFKKVVIADNCAFVVNNIFTISPSSLHGSTLLIGAFLFTIQIYCDFSGYSDMAIGIAKLFGLKAKKNFNYPYFSRNIAEFWRRWHISLTTWFRDYLYIPMGGSRVVKWKVIRNTFVIFLVSGLWHGANWTFIFWGFLHALLFMPLLMFNRNRKFTGNIAEGKWLPSFKEAYQMGMTFFWVMIAWVFFKSETIGGAFLYLSNMFSSSLLSPLDQGVGIGRFSSVLLCIAIMFMIEWIQREKEHALDNIRSWYVRNTLYYMILICLFWFGGTKEAFIYTNF